MATRARGRDDRAMRLPPLLALVFAVALRAQAPDPDGLPGARLLGGGGKLPPEVYARFLELAGGAQARIVVIPTASGTADQPEQREATLARWRKDHPGIAAGDKYA